MNFSSSRIGEDEDPLGWDSNISIDGKARGKQTQIPAKASISMDRYAISDTDGSHRWYEIVSPIKAGI